MAIVIIGVIDDINVVVDIIIVMIAYAIVTFIVIIDVMLCYH